jgi:hypothetical protein
MSARPRKEGLRNVPHASGHGDIIGWGSPAAQAQDNSINASPLATVAAENAALLAGGPTRGSGGGLSLSDLGMARPDAGADAGAGADAAAQGGAQKGGPVQSQNGSAAPGFPLDFSAQHRTLIRALTSRLGEVRELSHQWRRGGVPRPSTGMSSAGGGGGGGPSSVPGLSSEQTYLACLKQLRDSCHEWAAVDVLASLATCQGRVWVAGGQDADGGGEQGPRGVELRGGVPVWDGSNYTSLRWARYLVPVLESLLYSCYEDYVLVSLATLKSVLEALEPLFVAAADCDEDDLQHRDDDDDDAEEEDAETGAGEHKDAGDAAESKDDGGISAADIAWELRAASYAAAWGAVEAVRLTSPLVAALGSSAQNPGPSAKTAGSRARTLAEMHASVRHLTNAAAVASAAALSPPRTGGRG